MIKLADHTSRLTLMRIENKDHEDSEEADDEFDRVCERLFNATIDEIDDTDFDRLLDSVDRNSIGYCRSLGYDLIIGALVPVPYWEKFAIMIIAQNEGLLPKTPEERAQRRLEIEAREVEAEEREAEERMRSRLEAAAREFVAGKGRRN